MYENEKMLPLKRFPGLSPSDDVPELLKYLLSKDPNSTIRAQVGIFGGYEKCDYEQWKGPLNCAKDYVRNPYSFNCYIKGYSATYYEAQEFCKRQDADILNFEDEEDIKGFIILLNSSKI
jgi:hypothetical protein